MSAHHGPTLEVNLAAIARNYDCIKAKLSRGKAGAVVKANAYGLGALQIAPTIYKAGCRDFFVATLGEAMELRRAVPDAAIYVFHGVRKGQIQDMLAHRLTPVLNSLEQINHWNDIGPWILHIDTGMNRLGIAPEEVETVAAKKPVKLVYVMSHLACASDTEHLKNKEQLALFQQLLSHFPGIPASFANSSGVCLGDDYHFDLARPGRALYGISRGTKAPANLENVVTLSAPVLQYRTVTAAQAAVGYSATASVKKGTVLATIEFGYADGFLRTLSNKAHGFAAGHKLPIIGLVSMDMIMLDVSAIPESERTNELRITLIGKEQPIDTVAEMAGTIGYEIFTRLGPRIKRTYS